DSARALVAAAGAQLAGTEVVLANPRLAGLGGPGGGAAALAADLGADLLVTDLAGPPSDGPLGTGKRQPVRAPRLAKGSRLVLLTSGTTAPPKAIRLARSGRQGLAALALAGATGLRGGEPTLVWPPLCHGYGLAIATLCLITGSPMILPGALAGVGGTVGGGGGRGAAKGAVALAAIRRYGVRVVAAVPAQLGFLAAHLGSGSAPSGMGERIRTVVTGGDPLDAAVARAVQDRWGRVLVNFYGATESGTLTFAARWDFARDPTCAGRPAAGVRIEILDPRGRSVPPGETGRVRASSSLVSAPDTPGARLATLADLGYLDAAGNLHILGRALAPD
ncbi:MAG: AMP-binding protein, partial [Bifidobacteriaceae bacterium]|nr:AMP-binding protein [Bifidobacteriaceae bacterium]